MTAIHKKEVRLFPVVCKNKGCPTYDETKYLPFSERNMKWHLLPEAAYECQTCDITYNLCQIIHLVLPDENGQIQGYLETSKGSFVDHPIKRWEFACEHAQLSFRDQSKDSVDYPESFTTVPTAATCYRCLEVFEESNKEKNTKLMAYFNSKE